MSFLQKIQARNNFVKPEILTLYRLTTDIVPNKINHRIVDEGIDSVFGKGTYFSLDKADTIQYEIAIAKKFSIIVTYKAHFTRLLRITNKQADLYAPLSAGIEIFDMNLAEFIGEASLTGNELPSYLKDKCDAVLLEDVGGEHKVDGGDQVIVFPGTKIDLKPVVFDVRIVKGLKKKDIPWSEATEWSAKLAKLK